MADYVSVSGIGLALKKTGWGGTERLVATTEGGTGIYGDYDMDRSETPASPLSSLPTTPAGHYYSPGTRLEADPSKSPSRSVLLEAKTRLKMSPAAELEAARSRWMMLDRCLCPTFVRLAIDFPCDTWDCPGRDRRVPRARA